MSRSVGATTLVNPTANNKIPDNVSSQTSKQWGNFKVPDHPFFSENKEVLKPTPDWQNGYVDKMYLAKIDDLRKQMRPEDARIMNNRRIEIESSRMMGKNSEEQATRDFINEFILWCMGRSKNYSTKEKTPWGDHPLTAQEIKDFITEIEKKRTNYQLEIEKLAAKGKIRAPTNLWDAWLYFKYVVTNTDKKGNLITRDYLDDFAMYLEMNRKEYQPEEPYDTSAEPFYGCLGRARGMDLFKEEEADELLLDGTKLKGGGPLSQQIEDDIKKFKRIEEMYELELENMRTQFMMENDVTNPTKDEDRLKYKEHSEKIEKFINQKTSYMRRIAFEESDGMGNKMFKAKTKREVEKEYRDLKLERFKLLYSGYYKDLVGTYGDEFMKNIDETVLSDFEKKIEKEMASIDRAVEKLSPLFDVNVTKRKLKSLLTSTLDKNFAKVADEDMKEIKMLSDLYSEISEDRYHGSYNETLSLQSNIDTLKEDLKDKLTKRMDLDFVKWEKSIEQKFDEANRVDFNHAENMKEKMTDIKNKHALYTTFEEKKKTYQKFKELNENYPKLLKQRNEEINDLIKKYVPKRKEQDTPPNFLDSLNYYLTVNHGTLRKENLEKFLKIVNENERFLSQQPAFIQTGTRLHQDVVAKTLRVVGEEIPKVKKLEYDAKQFYNDEFQVPEQLRDGYQSRFNELLKTLFVTSEYNEDETFTKKLTEQLKQDKQYISEHVKNVKNDLKKLEGIMGVTFNDFNNEIKDELIEEGISKNTININPDKMRTVMARLSARIKQNNDEGYSGKNIAELDKQIKTYNDLVEQELLARLAKKSDLPNIIAHLKKNSTSIEKLNKAIEDIDQNVSKEAYLKLYENNEGDKISNEHIEKVRRIYSTGENDELKAYLTPSEYRRFESELEKAVIEHEEKLAAYKEYTEAYNAYDNFIKKESSPSSLYTTKQYEDEQKLSILSQYEHFVKKGIESSTSASVIQTDTAKIKSYMDTIKKKYVSIFNSLNIPDQLQKYFAGYETESINQDLYEKLLAISRDTKLKTTFKNFKKIEESADNLLSVLDNRYESFPDAKNYSNEKDYADAVDKAANFQFQKEFGNILIAIKENKPLDEVSTMINDTFYQKTNEKKTYMDPNKVNIVKFNKIEKDIKSDLLINPLKDEYMNKFVSSELFKAKTAGNDYIDHRNNLKDFKKKLPIYREMDNFRMKTKKLELNLKPPTTKQYKEIGALINSLNEEDSKVTLDEQELAEIGKETFVAANKKMIGEYNTYRNNLLSNRPTTLADAQEAYYLAEAQKKEKESQKMENIIEEEDLKRLTKLKTDISRDDMKFTPPTNDEKLEVLLKRKSDMETEIKKLQTEFAEISEKALKLESEKFIKKNLKRSIEITKEYLKKTENRIKEINKYQQEQAVEFQKNQRHREKIEQQNHIRYVREQQRREEKLEKEERRRIKEQQADDDRIEKMIDTEIAKKNKREKAEQDKRLKKEKTDEEKRIKKEKKERESELKKQIAVETKIRKQQQKVSIDKEKRDARIAQRRQEASAERERKFQESESFKERANINKNLRKVENKMLDVEINKLAGEEKTAQNIAMEEMKYASKEGLRQAKARNIQEERDRKLEQERERFLFQANKADHDLAVQQLRMMNNIKQSVALTEKRNSIIDKRVKLKEKEIELTQLKTKFQEERHQNQLEQMEEKQNYERSMVELKDLKTQIEIGKKQYEADLKQDTKKLEQEGKLEVEKQRLERERLRLESMEQKSLQAEFRVKEQEHRVQQVIERGKIIADDFERKNRFYFIGDKPLEQQVAEQDQEIDIITREIESIRAEKEDIIISTQQAQDAIEDNELENINNTKYIEIDAINDEVEFVKEIISINDDNDKKEEVDTGKEEEEEAVNSNDVDILTNESMNLNSIVTAKQNELDSLDDILRPLQKKRKRG